ncbi:MAG: hypothetical protein Phyf2KO_04210 [Phycisphaerales bacterium]
MPVRLVAYTVIAETDCSDSAESFADWLLSGHIADVVQAGALSGSLVKIDTDDSQLHRFEVRYMFASEADFRAYEAGPAVSLRAEGIALFGPDSEHSVRFERTLGTVLGESAQV